MFASVLGILVGVVAGLIPGIHTNLIAGIVATLSLDVWFAAQFLVAVAVTRSVIDALPSVFLGASDSLALLPGHRLLKKGRGADAVLLYVIGSVLGVIGCILAAPVLLGALSPIYEVIRPYLFWILLAALCILMWREKKAIIVVALCGILGYIALNSVKEPLFALLSGLFGGAGLVLSASSTIPLQKEREKIFPILPCAKASSIGVLAAASMLLFPGMGPSQAAALIAKERSSKFLVVLGALGTADVLLSLVAFVTIAKARNGAIVIIEQLLGSFSFDVFLALCAVALIAVGIASIITLLLCSLFAQAVNAVDYKLLAYGVFALLAIMSIVLSSWQGLLVFLTATAAGCIAPFLKVSRSHAMACLIVPTLILLWPF